jgi:hypothetical protein
VEDRMDKMSSYAQYLTVVKSKVSRGWVQAGVGG